MFLSIVTTYFKGTFLEDEERSDRVGGKELLEKYAYKRRVSEHGKYIF